MTNSYQHWTSAADKRQELRTVLSDGLVMLASIAVGGPIILLLTTLFSGVL
jgi:hypothetical protein